MRKTGPQTAFGRDTKPEKSEFSEISNSEFSEFSEKSDLPFYADYAV
jgi:hypothetical protein